MRKKKRARLVMGRALFKLQVQVFLVSAAGVEELVDGADEVGRGRFRGNAAGEDGLVGESLP